MYNIISDDFYDNKTYDMLLKTLTNEHKDYIQTIGGTTEDFLFKRWRTIINSLSSNYHEQYSSYQTQEERNDWFQRYLDYPTKDMSLMPEIL